MRINLKNSILFIFLILVLSCLSLAGCATVSQEQRRIWGETAPVCSTKSDCDAKWAAARRWVHENAGYKIQIYSDDFIETYNPIGYDPKIAVSVTKNPISTSNEGIQTNVISAKVWCANVFGCIPPINEAILSFNNYVSATQANDLTCYKSIVDDKTPRMGFSFNFFHESKKAIIKSICYDSPAYKAGLLPNDIILKIGNVTIMSLEDVEYAIKNAGFEATIIMEIMRNNIRQTYHVKLPSKAEALFIKGSLNKEETLSPAPSVEEKLDELQRLLQRGLITQEEYETKRKRLIDGL